VAHLLQGAHSSLTKGYHYTVRDFKLSLLTSPLYRLQSGL
jgi:hypothetical protein